MFHLMEDRLREAVESHLKNRYDVDVEVVVELPKQAAFGELALPVSFSLAKVLKRAPRQIAEELCAELPPVHGVDSVEVAGGGFLNIRLDRAAYVLDVLQPSTKAAQHEPKAIVEHTNINPNKSAHIGHLRNAVLGDTLVRMLRAAGHPVEAQNYIDNTGVQVADVVAAFHFLDKKSAADVQALVDDPNVRFDYHCWDLYAKISRHYIDAPDSLAWRAQTLHALEDEAGELGRLGRLIADAIVNCHLDTMLRLGVEYDVLPRESEILQLKFWAAAFELLKQRGAVHLESEGKNAGCWVMPSAMFRSAMGETNTDGDDEVDASKVIVRSDGTVTYVGKDIAYQLWKFGLLKDKDFRYQVLRHYPSRHPLWVTTAASGTEDAPTFGSAALVYNVIDVRQSYLQDVVRAGLKALGFTPQAEKSIHFSYEMVALSPACCIELGIELSDEDRRRPYIEVSGRKGLGVKADDLIDRLGEAAFNEVKSRQSELPEDQQRRIASQIAVGALRYFMLRFTRTTVIAFDFQEALSFEGETGPYLQYAAVRARRILSKYVETHGTLPDFNSLSKAVWAQHLADENLWQLLLAASRSKWIVARALAVGEPAQVARHAFQVAQTFNNFYHHSHILNEEDSNRQIVLLAATKAILGELDTLMGIMGMPAPEVM